MKNIAMNSKCSIILLFLILIAMQATYALKPDTSVSCCQQQKENINLPEYCSNVQLENCNEILKNWTKTEDAWLKSTTPFYLWPEFIAGLIIALIIIVSIIIWKFMKKK